MNMVGTPCSAVQRSCAIAASVAPASKPADGSTMRAPWATQASVPSTMPKQWYIGTGMHIRSAGVSFICRPTK